MTEPITVDRELLYAMVGGIIAWLMLVSSGWIYALKAIASMKAALQGGAGAFANINNRLDKNADAALAAVLRPECDHKHDKVDTHLDKQDATATKTHDLVEQLDRKVVKMCGEMIGRFEAQKDLFGRIQVGMKWDPK